MYQKIENVQKKITIFSNSGHYFPPDLRLPSMLQCVTVLRPVPNYTA